MRYSDHSHNKWHSGQQHQWQEFWADRPPPRPRMSARARLLLPAAISFLLQVPPALWLVVQRGSSRDAIAILILSVLGPLALIGARRWPGPVVVVVAAAASADFVLGDSTLGPPYVALAFAIVGAIVRNARLWAWISVGVLWATTLAAGIILELNWNPSRVAVVTLGILIVFGVGEAVRTRREVFDEYRRSFAQRKQTEVQAERVRIARELHDVLAHSLSQINVQASVGLHLMDKQPEKASEALASIKETSKTALDEVRSVLGVLRAEDGQDPGAPLVPEPDLSRLPGLAASVTSQGVAVTIDGELGNPPKAVQLAIYRIVQESLTNVVRHARATRASVVLTNDGDTVVVSISDDGVGLGDQPSEGGRGMLGMRERAELLGGTLDVDTGSLGGVTVTARIPQQQPLHSTDLEKKPVDKRPAEKEHPA